MLLLFHVFEDSRDAAHAGASAGAIGADTLAAILAKQIRRCSLTHVTNFNGGRGRAADGAFLALLLDRRVCRARLPCIGVRPSDGLFD